MAIVKNHTQCFEDTIVNFLLALTKKKPINNHLYAFYWNDMTRYAKDQTFKEDMDFYTEIYNGDWENEGLMKKNLKEYTFYETNKTKDIKKLRSLLFSLNKKLWLRYILGMYIKVA